jgi:hypothetical protein
MAAEARANCVSTSSAVPVACGCATPIDAG